MAASFEEWKKKQAASKAPANTSTKTASTDSGFEAWKKKQSGVAPIEAKKPVSDTSLVGMMNKRKTIEAAPLGPAVPESLKKTEVKAPVEPAKKTITQRIGDTVKKGLGMLGSVNLPSAIAGQASKMAATAAVKDPKVTAEKVGNVALRTGTALASSTVSGLRFAQEKIQNDPTIFQDPVTKFIRKTVGGGAVDKKLTQLSQWAAQYDPTGPMLKKADESLQEY